MLTVILALFCFVGCEDEVIDPAATELKREETPLLDTLIRYLKRYESEDLIFFEDKVYLTVEDQINRIKRGSETLHIGFNASSEKYYVCAYYNFEEGHNEKSSFCCAEKYTWVRYEKASDIKEYYGEENFFVAFQLDRASFVNDILTDEVSDTNIENYQLYKPEFKDGVNTSAELVTDKTFIHLNSGSTTLYFHSLGDFPCIYLDGKCYILLWVDEEFDDQYLDDISYELGEYKDELMAIMKLVKYEIVNQDGNPKSCALVEIKEFINTVLK